MSISVVVSVAELEQVANNLLRVDNAALAKASVRGVNESTQRIYDESRRIMLSGVNLTDDYVRQRMTVEPANDENKPEAVIAAFRSGGSRRPNTRPVNLRQYAAVQLQAPVRFDNSDPRIVRGDLGTNPRAPGKALKWKKRVGAPQLSIPVGQKQAGISVEVLKGQRKTLPFAFFASARRGAVAGGQGLLVFTRDKNDKKGKGKLRPLYSLMVWQLFRDASAKVIPFARKDLEQSLANEVAAEAEKALQQ
jgi:hypothetical protein